MSLDREQLETTSLSLRLHTATGDGLAPFKTYQAGYIDGTGSMTVQLTADAEHHVFPSAEVILSQTKLAQIRLYINTVCVAGEIDNTASAYIEAPISILGFSFTVSPEEVTTATVNFTLLANRQSSSFDRLVPITGPALVAGPYLIQ